MAGLAEDELDGSGAGRRWGTALAVLAVLALLVAAGIGLKNLMSAKPPPARQVARIAVLPDTPPPPPPPPPKEAPKPEARDDHRPPPPTAVPKPQEAPAPANEPLKMEGTAGNGPSAFQSGSVSREYQGGPVVGGSGGGGGTAAPAADRAQERFYATTARQLLRDDLDRRLQDGETRAMVADFSLWIAADGAIRRYELRPTGDARADAELRAALDETVRALRLPAPPAIPQPMRFRLTLRSG